MLQYIRVQVIQQVIERARNLYAVFEERNIGSRSFDISRSCYLVSRLGCSSFVVYSVFAAKSCKNTLTSFGKSVSVCNNFGTAELIFVKCCIEESCYNLPTHNNFVKIWQYQQTIYMEKYTIFRRYNRKQNTLCAQYTFPSTQRRWVSRHLRLSAGYPSKQLPLRLGIDQSVLCWMETLVRCLFMIYCI
jgi:hypothetical protein